MLDSSDAWVLSPWGQLWFVVVATSRALLRRQPLLEIKDTPVGGDRRSRAVTQVPGAKRADGKNEFGEVHLLLYGKADVKC